MSGATAQGPVRPGQLRLKPQVDMYRHVYQGQTWYVFHDRAAHRYYRVSGEGAELLGALDGRRGLEEVMTARQARDGEAASDPQDVLKFMQHLHALDLLRTETVPDIARLDARRAAMKRRLWIGALRTPLSLKLKLLDPTRMLSLLMPWFGWIFSPAGMLLWLAVVATGAVIGAMHWGELTADVSDRLLSTENLLLAGAVYPLVKVLHELGHGLALRRLGAEVREIGILFAAFIPVPYVDASASAVLERRRDRMMVGAAGILVEMFLGAIALMIWSQAESGVLRAICYNVVMISGFSTLLFNGNPLQRYDGYYILTDLLGMPGLGMRSAQYLGGLFRRHLMGDAAAAVPVTTPAERWWFALYAPASFIYRLSLMLVISFYVAERYPGFGLILAVWSVIGYFAAPVGGLIAFVRKSEAVTRQRGLIGLGALTGAVAVLLFAVPAPRAVIAQGVVMMPDDAGVRPQVNGVVAGLLATPGGPVTQGQPLARLDDPEVDAKVRRGVARLAELRAQLTEAQATEPGRAGPIHEMLVQAQHEQQEAERDQAALVVRSPAAGTFLVPQSGDLPGRYMPRGQAFATIWDPGRAVIRAVTPLSDIALLRTALRETTPGVTVRPGWDVMQSLPADVLRLVPEATDLLPSGVLAIEGGGPFAAQHDRDGQARMAEPGFEIQLRTHDPLPETFLNGRMHVRFALPPEPLGLQLWRSVRLVFLRRLHA